MEIGERMARIKSRDTKPEMALRRALWASGARYRVQVRLPGTPDLAFPAARLAIFVDGCFWHGCPVHFKGPKSNAEFWLAKIGANQARDKRVDAELATLGWTVLRFWEHEITKSALACATRVMREMGR